MTAFNLKGIYECTFSGVPIGKMGVEIEQTPQHYAITGDIISTGILKMFVNHTSHTSADGSGHNFTYSAINYETHYQTKKKRKSAQMKYQNGVVTQEQVTPPDNRATRPAVPAALKKGSTDPLSLSLRMREALFAARQQHKQNFSLTMYDGRRLTQLDFAIIGPQSVTYNHERVPVITVDVRRKALAGFTDSELGDLNPHEPPLHVYFKDDATLLPLRLELQLFLGTLSASLVKQCLPGESCLLGIRE